MANAKGHKHIANHRKDQVCYISIKDPDNALLFLDQDVAATGNKSPGGAYDSSYTGKIVSAADDHKTCVARLKCTNSTVTFNADERLLDNVPDGTLTVTISGGPPVDPIDVVYVADAPTP
jgi:hypothetical protein